MTMKAMTPKSLAMLRLILFGGEGYPKTELKKLYDLFSQEVALVNVYGPTECTCICSAHRLSEDDFRSIEGLPTLGKPNQNFDYRILDENGEDQDSGELCLIGPNVAAGYFNDLERSAMSFFTLTDHGRFMKRMYKTGDLVRVVDGNLYFVGRKDNQIKHMGYRIELEEIELALNSVHGISQAAVIYERVSDAYGKIVAFVASEKDISENALREELKLKIPDYMIPSRVRCYRALPKNSNGKIDKQALRELFWAERS